MKNIIAYFFKVTTIRSIVGMSAIYLIFPLYLLPNVINAGSTGPVDLLFWYDHNTLYHMVASYGESIRSRYIMGLLTVDIAYPIFYGTLLTMITALIIKKLSIPFPHKIIFLPYVIVFFDLIENATLVFLLSTYPAQHTVIADIAGFVTATKWSTFAILFMFLIFLVIYGIRIRKKATTNSALKEP